MRKKSKLFFSSLIIMLIYLTFITPNIYASTAKDYNVNTKKSNSSLVITDKKVLEKAIKQVYSGESQKNLLKVLNDGTFMKLQEKYNVNAVFAIAVVTIESGCGTGWATIPASTYNWFSIQGSYNGSSVKVANREWRKYSSFSEATLDFGDIIANSSYYFKAGNYTVSKIAIPYCNKDWGVAVFNQMTKIYNATKNIIYGDVNLDGKVDMQDVSALSSYLKGEKKLTSVQVKAADLNGDGKVTSHDQTLVICKIMGTIKYYPIEVKYGDLDGDGKITEKDYNMVVKYIKGNLKLTDKQKLLADVNMNRTVNENDAKLILQRAQGLIVALPIESQGIVTLSTSDSEKIIKASREVSQNMIDTKNTYSLSDLIWGDIKQAAKHRYYCCATYVSVVLYKSGVLTEKQINPYNYHYTGAGGIPDMLKAAGWTQVKASEAKPGDIINVYGYHALIYAGGDYCYDETCAQDEKTIEPRPLWPVYKNNSSTQVWRAPKVNNTAKTNQTTTKTSNTATKTNSNTTKTSNTATKANSSTTKTSNTATKTNGSTTQTSITTAEKIVKVADQLHKAQQNWFYYTDTKGLGGLYWNDIEKALDNQNKVTSCATYTSSVLYKAGCFTEKEMNSFNYNQNYSLYDFLKSKGWKEINNYSELKSGDIVFMNDMGHVQIYAGNAKWYSAGSTDTIQGVAPFSQDAKGSFTKAMRSNK